MWNEQSVLPYFCVCHFYVWHHRSVMELQIELTLHFIPWRRTSTWTRAYFHIATFSHIASVACYFSCICSDVIILVSITFLRLNNNNQQLSGAILMKRSISVKDYFQFDAYECVWVFRNINKSWIEMEI